METVQQASPPSFETVWAALQETDRILKENAERHEREMKENAERHERKMKELDERVRESKEELNRQLGKYINLFGEFTEYMMAPKLCEEFIEFGFNFYKTTRNISVRDKVNNIFFEIDVMLENDDIAMLVEIKTKLTIQRINDHIERLGKMRKYADLRGDKRAFLGAVAGVVVTDIERNYALEQGFYLIEPAGENLIITAPNGKPKEW